MPNLFAKPIAAGLADGSSWPNCFGPAELDAWATAAALPDDDCYCLSGAYAMPAIVSGRDGSKATPIRLIGVKNESMEWASGLERPAFAFGANIFQVDQWWKLHNLRISGSAATVARGNNGTVWTNCLIESASLLAASQGLYLGDLGAKAVDCEVTNPNGRGIFTVNSTAITGCTVRDSLVGIRTNGDANTVAANLIYNCPTGVRISGNRIFNSYIGNTLYNGVTGFQSTLATADRNLFLRNIIAGFTTPADWVANYESNVWDWNVWWNSGTPVNVTKGPNAIDADPGFVDPAALDFRLKAVVEGPPLPGVADGGALVGAVLYGTPYSPPAGSYAADQLTLDGLELVQLDGVAIANAYRLQETVEEMDPSQGVYQARNVEFQLPTGVYGAGADPRIGGLVTDAAAVEYRILAVRQPYMGDYWGLVTRSLAISGEYNLDHAITLWPYVDSTDPIGSRLTTFPAADASFTDVPCRIQEQPEQLKDHIGKRGFARRFDIFLDLVLFGIRRGDRLIDQEGTQYAIAKSRNRTDNSRYSVIEAVIDP